MNDFGTLMFTVVKFAVTGVIETLFGIKVTQSPGIPEVVFRKTIVSSQAVASSNQKVMFRVV